MSERDLAKTIVVAAINPHLAEAAVIFALTIEEDSRRDTRQTLASWSGIRTSAIQGAHRFTDDADGAVQNHVLKFVASPLNFPDTDSRNGIPCRLSYPIAARLKVVAPDESTDCRKNGTRNQEPTQ